MTERLTRRQAAIIGAFTGITLGPFEDIQEYAEEKFERPLWTHEFGSETFADDLKERSRQDFYDICAEKED